MHPMQMQTFPTSDAYQPRCAVGGIANLGIGTSVPVPVAGTKQYKVHGGNATFGNFNNYVHGSDLDARGMTRIVFNGNNFCAPENFQGCLPSEIVDNTGAYQLNFVNPGANLRYIRQQMNPSFHGDNQMHVQRCYIQRSQGQQGRFVRVQGSKMRPNVTYRNFNNNQQRQKQNRRFNTKGFSNHYKTQKSSASAVSNADGLYQDDGSPPNHCLQQQEFRDTSEKEQDAPRKSPQRSIIKQEQEDQQFKSNNRSFRSSSTDFCNRMNKTGSKSNLVEPKVEYFRDAFKDLSYDDISENSDDNHDTDLRERLIRKKHDQIIKREPGELDSDDDEPNTWPENKGTSNKRRLAKVNGTSADDNSNIFKKPDVTPSYEYSNKDSKRSKKSAKRISGRNSQKENTSTSCSRFSSNEDNYKAVSEEPRQKLQCPSNTDSTYSHYYCCTDLAEVTDLKKSLREAQDKLLEANVLGTKKSVKMQEEIIQLKRQLEEVTKSENELKVSLKNMENELSVKNSELTKVTLLHEVEKQEKGKLRTEISHTFKARLAIEVEKLRALFDVEVAKMQAYYLSSNIYDNEASNSLTDTVPNGDAQNQSDQTVRNNIQMVSGNAGENVNHSPRNTDCETPFLESYFNIPTQSSMSMAGLTRSSLFENVMAYNSLFQQHVYAQAGNSTSSIYSDGSGNCNINQ